MSNRHAVHTMHDVKTKDQRMARLLAALRSGNAALIESLCHPEMVVEDPGSLPYGGIYHGFWRRQSEARRATEMLAAATAAE